jgi:hypothetical protein
MRAAMPGFGFSFARIGVVALVASLALAACSSNTGSTNGTVASSSASATATVVPPGGGGATSAASPTPSATPEATAVQTALDPCQMVTAQEASQLAGATYTAGVESTTSGGGKICTYGGQTRNVFEVILAQAPDVATAKAEEADAKAGLTTDYPGVKVTITQITDLQNGAATPPPGGIDAEAAQASATISGIQFGAIGMYLLKGATFVGFSDVEVGGTAPTLDAMKAQASIVLGRIP